MNQIEQLPKYQALGLKLGLLRPDDIQSWVNARILESEEPDDQLLDLAFSKDQKGYDLYSVLIKIGNSGNKYEIVRLLLSKVSDHDLNNLSYCSDLAKSLEHFAIDCDYDVPEDLNPIYGFDDEYNLAKQGVYSSLKQWHKDFKEFVSGFGKNY
jgi:hypothetical protein